MKNNIGNEGAFAMLDPNSQFMQYGLSKREYFCAMALNGICSNQEFMQNLDRKKLSIPKAIIEIADALLIELENDSK